MSLLPTHSRVTVEKGEVEEVLVANSDRKGHFIQFAHPRQIGVFTFDGTVPSLGNGIFWRQEWGPVLPGLGDPLLASIGVPGGMGPESMPAIFLGRVQVYFKGNEALGGPPELELNVISLVYSA